MGPEKIRDNHEGAKSAKEKQRPRFHFLGLRRQMSASEASYFLLRALRAFAVKNLSL